MAAKEPTAVAAARLGGDVTFICKIGSMNIFGNENLGNVSQRKDRHTYVGITPAGTVRSSSYQCRQKGENCIVVASGAKGLYLLMTYSMQTCHQTGIHRHHAVGNSNRECHLCSQNGEKKMELPLY